jgi:hypothetical protein
MVDGWWLVAGGWWLVAGGWWLKEKWKARKRKTKNEKLDTWFVGFVEFAFAGRADSFE